MTFADSIKSCISKYATFRGRAPRSKYWWFYLFNILMQFVVAVVFAFIGYVFGDYVGMMLSVYIGLGLYSLMVFIPGLAVLVRRLHDTGRSGWWYFICLVPFIGWIWLLILLVTDSDEENQYGLPVY